jgi:hypothetical protein
VEYYLPELYNPVNRQFSAVLPGGILPDAQDRHPKNKVDLAEHQLYFINGVFYLSQIQDHCLLLGKCGPEYQRTNAGFFKTTMA